MSALSAPDAFELAQRHHQAGHLPEAERLYRQILAQCPAHAGAMHLLGLLAGQVGQHAAAADLIRQSLALAPENPDAWYNLGRIFAEAGHVDAAIDAYRRAVSLRPDFAAAFNNLGNLLQDKGQLDQAIVAWRCAIAGRGDLVQAYNNLALGLRASGDLPGAIAAWQHALALQPDFPKALNNLGAALTDIGRSQEGAALCQRAIAVHPTYVNAHNNLGIALRNLGMYDQSAACYRRAIEINPDFAEAHLNLALDLLMRGQWSDGWRQREWRWKVPGLQSGRTYAQPKWQRQDLTGRTILLHHEQGLGDTLQFVRYVPLLAQRGAAVLLDVQCETRRLVERVSGVTAVVDPAAPLPSFDFYCPLMSLPLGFATTVDSIPSHLPYLSPDPPLAEKWKAKISPNGRRKIGLAWAGNPRHSNDRNRSIPLPTLKPLLQSPDTEFFSLQKGDAAQQAIGEAIIDWTANLNDFADTAALIAQLDLVISVDTAVAHLAGAMGKPVWLLIPFVPDWRWMLGSDRSPWYPTMRLFRQKNFADWPEVITRVAAALSN